MASGEKVRRGWGCEGCQRAGQRGERRELYSSGGQVGARATVVLYPEEGLVLAVMTNLTNAEIDPMLEKLLATLLPAEPASMR